MVSLVRCDSNYSEGSDSNIGATNYRGNLVFTGEGQGNNIAPALYLVNPVAPYNSTGEHTFSKIFFPVMLTTPRSTCQQLLRQTIHFSQ